MNFTEIAQTRQSCRGYDESRDVEQQKLDAILESARMAPQPAMASPITSPSAVVRPRKRSQLPPLDWV